MAQEYLTVLGTISGVITGFLLNEINTRRKEKRQIQSVRMLISLEIDKNIEMLYDLWDKVNKIDPDNENEDKMTNSEYKLINLPSTYWKNESWKSQISFLPIALNKDEIRKVNDFYDDIENIKSIQLSLLSLAEEDAKGWRAVNSKHGMFISYKDLPVFPEAFKQRAPALWAEFEKITLKLLENRNPLSKENLWELYELKKD